MLADTLTINDGTADLDFVKTKVLSDGAMRLNDATTALEPETLIIRHQVAGGAGTAVDRHLVQLKRTELDTEGVAQDLQVNLTLAVPRSATFNVADVTRLVTLVINTIETRVAEIARGES